jgi:hypothetical protein
LNLNLTIVLMDDKSFEFWENGIILHFQGKRDEVSPYTGDLSRGQFLARKLNLLLEKYPVNPRLLKRQNLSTGYSMKDRPFHLRFSNDLLLYFSNGAKIHRFNLLDSGRYIEIIDLNQNLSSSRIERRNRKLQLRKIGLEGNIYRIFADRINL